MRKKTLDHINEIAEIPDLLFSRIKINDTQRIFSGSRKYEPLFFFFNRWFAAQLGPA
jgi:hypothetical protein